MAAAPVAWAGRRDKRPDEPPPVANPAPVPEAAAQDSGPKAPPLFPDGLPAAVDSVPAGLASLSAQGCNACHMQVHDDWTTSAHRGAWLDEPFRSAVEATGNAPLCMSCHLPLEVQQPIQVVEYAGGPLSSAKVRDNPAWDPTLQQEGVGCAACHVRGGFVVGTRASSAAPHPVAVSDELQSPAFCATCHQLTWPGADKPFYDTWGEWSASAYAKAGVRCQDCHMPQSAGLVTAGRFVAHASHGFPADPARAVSILVDVAPDAATRGKAFQARVRVQNTGAGHAFPTGSPFVGVLLEAVLLDAEGKEVGAPFTHRFARTVATDPPYRTLEDTRLPAGGEVVLQVDTELPQSAGGGAGTFEVRLRKTGVDGTPGDIFHVQRIPMTVY